MFLFCVTTFEPIITKTSKAPKNDCQSLNFLKNRYTQGEKMARKVRTKAIYKVSFISEHTLFELLDPLWSCCIHLTWSALANSISQNQTMEQVLHFEQLTCISMQKYSIYNLTIAKFGKNRKYSSIKERT